MEAIATNAVKGLIRGSREEPDRLRGWIGVLLASVIGDGATIVAAGVELLLLLVILLSSRSRPLWLDRRRII